MGLGFFLRACFPLKSRMDLNKELMFLARGSEGGISYSEIQEMDTVDRRQLLEILIDIREKEEEEFRKAQARARSRSR